MFKLWLRLNICILFLLFYSGQSPTDSFNAPNMNVAILEIDRFSQQDQGLYICEARNEAGVAEKRIQLVIQSLPSRGDIVGKFVYIIISI